MSIVKLQAEISGYQGKAVNLLGALDTDSGLFIISKEMPAGERVEGATVISNDPRAERRDCLFTEDRLQDAIRLYFRASATEMIELLDTVAKHNPAHKIQSDGVGENGTKYSLSPEVTNGNVAVLALLDAADVTYKAQSATDFSSELADLFLSI